MSVAYWISPKGEIIDVKTKHISSVIDNPKKFGFDRDFIDYIHDFYGEKIGTEGKAREQIMKVLFKDGWIRIRQYKNFWTVNVKRMAGRSKSYLTEWAKKVLKGLFGFKEQDKFIPIKIDQENKPIKSVELQDIADSNKFVSEYMLIERDIKELDDIKGDIMIKVMKNMRRPLFNDHLNESSLSRIWGHNQKHDCAAMTAFRDKRDCGKGEPYTNKENKFRNKSLLAKLKVKGYGVTSLKGVYPEGGKTKKEESFFIVDLNDTGDLLKDVKNLGKEFEQDSILYIPKGSINNEDNAFLIGTNKCENNWLGFGKKEFFKKGKLGVSSKIYTSKVNGRPFIFEHVGSEFQNPGNGMGVWAMNVMAKKHWTELE